MIENEEEELYEHYRFTVDKGQSLLRIDKYLLLKIPNATRTKIQFGIDTEFVKVNSKAVKPSYKVKPLDCITVVLPTPVRTTEVLPENIPLDILYEDQELLLVNKPAGMVVHPAFGNWTGTLVNALVFYCNQNLPSTDTSLIRPGLVHRIDKDTSGILVIAKTEWASTHLSKQFFDHSIERTYFALVWGEPKPSKGTIRANIGRSTRDRKVMMVHPENEGKQAITHYEVIESLGYVSLVKYNLETGRTHQIRIHSKHIGHPLVGDKEYGGDKVLRGPTSGSYRQFVFHNFERLPHQALHAQSLGFIHPTTGKKIQFESPIPANFLEVLHQWRKYFEHTLK